MLAGDSGIIFFDFDENYSRSQVLSSIDRLPHYQSRFNLASALRVTRERLLNGDNGDRTDVSNVAVVLSAGIPNDNDLVSHF